MLSHQQNPHAVSFSLQQMGSKDINSEDEADVKTFSIRQYVLACRQRSILQSWPFHEKYLQMCLDRGLRNVLPPIGLHNNSVSDESSQNNAFSNWSSTSDTQYDDNEEEEEEDDDDKNVKVFKSEEAPDHHHHQHHPLEQKQQKMIKPDDDDDDDDDERSKAMMIKSNQSKASKGDKMRRRRRRRRGIRCKKRSMVEILAVAKRCTLEEIYRINQFSYTGTPNFEGYYSLQNDPKRTETDDYDEVANNY